MSEMERVEIATRIKAMTDDEQEITVKSLPTGLLLKEIDRRTSRASEIITSILTITSNMTADMTLEEMQRAIAAIKNELRA